MRALIFVGSSIGGAASDGDANGILYTKERLELVSMSLTDRVAVTSPFRTSHPEKSTAEDVKSW